MRAIMVVGTASHAGKSLIATALCRLLNRRGWRVAPFKAQTIGPNTYVTATGAEIGYAQAVQAWAAGVMPQSEMNPILLKPQGDQLFQVIVKGRLVGRVNFSQYYSTFIEPGWQATQETLHILSQDYDFLVCEGSGNPADFHLQPHDLANMRVAQHLQAPTVLVADGDRGGLFAHIIGTLDLMEPEAKALVKGIVINKFRDPQEMLEPRLAWLTERTGIPVLGMVPWLTHDLLPQDTLSLLNRTPNSQKQADVTIAVLRLPRISNFTDFDPLEAEPNVRVVYLNPKDQLGYPDAVIIPGTKTTVADLLALQQSGMGEQIRNYVAAGGTVLGICGGFQMMGQFLADPEGIEGHEGRFPALDLFPMRTVITQQKIARQRTITSRFPSPDFPYRGTNYTRGAPSSVSPRQKSKPARNLSSCLKIPALGW